MEALANLIPRNLDQIKATSTKPLSYNPPESKALSLKDDADGKLTVLNALAVCADTLNTYGKTPGQLNNAGKAFNMVLADCNAGEVREAFKVWMTRSAEMPTPFDILNLVQRKGKPPLDRAVYIGLCKRRDSDPYAYNVLSPEERDYIRDYEKFQISGKVA